MVNCTQCHVCGILNDHKMVVRLHLHAHYYGSVMASHNAVEQTNALISFAYCDACIFISMNRLQSARAYSGPVIGSNAWSLHPLLASGTTELRDLVLPSLCIPPQYACSGLMITETSLSEHKSRTST